MAKNKYWELWEFIVLFQRIPCIITKSIQIILNKNWLESNFWNKDNENIISRIILAEMDLYQLINIYKSLVSKLYWEKSFNIVKKVTTIITAYIVKYRNDISKISSQNA